MKSRISVYTVSFIAAVGILGGCSHRAPSSIEVVQGRYDRLRSDPNVREAGKESLIQAHKHLQYAREEWRRDGAGPDLDHQTYLADRNLDSAVEQSKIELARESQKEILNQQEQLALNAKDRRVARANLRADIAENDSKSYRAQVDAQNQQIDKLRREVDFARAEQTKRGLELALTDVLFETDQSELLSGTERKLEPLITYLRRQPEKRILVEGFADSVGSSDYNRNLAQRRADAVRSLFIQRGIDAGRVQASGVGEEFPVAPNNGSAGRLQNRRVQIILLD